ncbi:MAG: DUF3168 domain-containing protein [Pseudomonadota bacterium]
MSSALEAVQVSLVSALQDSAELMEMISGVYDGPPPRAEFPYVSLTTSASRDWSHKTGTGRALSIGLTVHDSGTSAVRIGAIMARVEAALEQELTDPDDWQIVTFTFRRSRIVRSATGPWRGLIEYRARCLQT